MESDATHMCELLVGLPEVNVLGIEDERGDEPRVHVERRIAEVFCEACGIRATVKDRPVVALVDLPCFGRATRLVWHKRRWCCPDDLCAAGSWTEEETKSRIEGRLLSSLLALAVRTTSYTHNADGGVYGLPGGASTTNTGLR